MTEQSTETVAAEPAAESAQPAAEVTEGNGEGDGTLSHEAAKYRRKLRDTETERDELAATVETMRRAEVERLAADKLSMPGALWNTGIEIADLLGDDGQVSPDAVMAASDRAVTEYGLAGPPAPVGVYVPAEGREPDHSIPPPSNFSEAFRPKK